MQHVNQMNSAMHAFYLLALISAATLVVLPLAACLEHLSCKLGSQQPVDMFVALKPPDSYELHVIVPGAEALSHTNSSLLVAGNPVSATLEPLHSGAPGLEYLVYNDEDPETGREHFAAAHSKGTLLVLGQRALWLQHSVPRFPHASGAYPHAQAVYGQHFACVTVGRQEALLIATAVLKTSPNVVRCSAALCQAADRGASHPLHQCHRALSTASALDPIQTSFKTAGGQTARIIGKRGIDHGLLWDDFVAPALGCTGMIVESWLHGPGRIASQCTPATCVLNNARVHMPLASYGVLQDHSKWGVCCDTAALCFGDMNREVGQLSRGGMVLCFAADSAAGRQMHAWFEQISESEAVCDECSCGAHV